MEETMVTWMVAAVLMSPRAEAFCGYYAGSAGAEFYNFASEVGIVRQGERTTMTLANGWEGNATDFALILPIPELIDKGDVRIADPAIFDRLDEYTAPREVTYDCPDTGWGDSGWWSTTSSWDTGSGSGTTSTVTVHTEFVVGSYEIVVLSAAESSGLLTWLNDNGYETSVEAADVLQGYIDGGMYFFAAKVTLEDTESGYLEPLQFGFDAEELMLPIRLGTLNSGGCRQDVILYLLTDDVDGRVEVANYPEVVAEDDCMYRPDKWDSFSAFYEHQLASAMSKVDHGPAWINEYAWPSSGCDPCVTTALTDGEVTELGFVGRSSESFTTRIHLRYDADEVTEDVAFRLTGNTATSQQRFIQHSDEQEDTYPICNRGWVVEPGSCDGKGERPHTGLYHTGALPPVPLSDTACTYVVPPPLETDPTETSTTDPTPTETTEPTVDGPGIEDTGRSVDGEAYKPGCGCATGGGGVAGVWWLGLLVALRRR
jgi:hypothetical protein